jgi:hypothetical protein
MRKLPSLVFEPLHDLNLLVVHEGKNDPTDADWDIYSRANESMSTKRPLRVLVVTDGGSPSAAQRQKLLAFTRRRRPKIAVVTTAVRIRFMLSIFALVNPDARSFLPIQLGAALAYLGLTATEAKAVSELVAQMRLALPTPGPTGA